MKIYTAPWCSTCKAVKRYLDKEGIEVEFVDVDEHPEEAQDKRILALPTLLDEGGVRVVGTDQVIKYVKEKQCQ